MKREAAPDVDPGRLAREERRAARRVKLGPTAYVLVGALVAYVVALFVPQVTGVRGWQVLIAAPEAREQGIKLPEYVLSWLAFAGVGVLTTVTLVTRRTAAALIAWMLLAVGLVFSLLSVWLRMQRPSSEAGVSAGLGTYLLIAAVAVSFVCYCLTALRRSPEQEEIARKRAQTTQLDPVAQAQQESFGPNRAAESRENPLLIDDRRQRAHERAQRRRRRTAADKTS